MGDIASKLTVLTTLGISAVKTFTMREDNTIHVEGYGKAKRFKAKEIDADDEGNWLRKLLHKKHSFVVLGEPIDWPLGELRRRLSEDDGDDKATLRDVPRWWFPIDLDHLNFTPWASFDDGETLAVEALDMLGLKGKRCLWHLTASHAITGKHRIRLWMSLKEPATCAAMKEHAHKWDDLKIVDEEGKHKACVDTSILRPAQPIYTGTPEFFEPVYDPVGVRVGLIEGKRLKIKSVEAKKKKAHDGSNDQNVERLQDAGLYIRPAGKPGHHMIVCPWEDDHSGESKDNDTFYYEPNYEGRDEPFFRCFHESCQAKKRWWRDVEQKMGWSSAFTKVGEAEDEEEFVYVHRLEQFWDPRDGAMITIKAYNSMNGHSDAKKRGGSPTDRFLASPKSRKVDSMEFLPGRSRVVNRDGISVLNTYMDKRVRPDDGVDASQWIEHLEWLIPDDVDRAHLMDWLAWTYQKPGEKITWAPILYSKSYGVGKTTVFNCLSECIGKTMVSEPTQSELEDKFNDWCFGKLLVKIEELMSEDKFHVAEKLKPVVANPTISIRRMHQTGFSVENTANVCASTNHMAALPIEKGDRRWMVIQCVEAGKRERRPRMRAFHRWLEKTGYAGIAHWLASRDVSKFMPKGEAPSTKLKDVIVDASMTEIDRAVELCDVYDKEDLVTSTAIMDMFESNNIKMYPNKLGMIAIRRGWLSLSGQEGRVRHGKGKVTLWSPAGSQEAIEQVKAMESGPRTRFLEKLNAKSVFKIDSAQSEAQERWKPRS